MRFIVVNGRILDLEKYRKDFSLLQKIIHLDAKECLCKLGLVKKGKEVRKFSSEVIFYNQDLDMEIKIFIKKKEKLQFV